MKNPPAEMQAQPGQAVAEFLFDYDRQIQPVWDAHCVSCHGEDAANLGGNLDLRGTHQSVYSVSYLQLLGLGYNGGKQLLGNRNERNEDAADNEIRYIPPYYTGALSSPLSGWLSGDGITLPNETLKKYTQYLKDVHPDVQLSDEELLRVNNWLDVNCLYHPAYWGRLNSQHSDHPNYRPVFTPDECRMRELPPRVKEWEGR